jgi:hypothetical protein
MAESLPIVPFLQVKNHPPRRAESKWGSIDKLEDDRAKNAPNGPNMSARANAGVTEPATQENAASGIANGSGRPKKSATDEHESARMRRVLQSVNISAYPWLTPYDQR